MVKDRLVAIARLAGCEESKTAHTGARRDAKMQSFLCLAPFAHFAAWREPVVVRAWIDSSLRSLSAPPRAELHPQAVRVALSGLARPGRRKIVRHICRQPVSATWVGCVMLRPKSLATPAQAAQPWLARAEGVCRPAVPPRGRRFEPRGRRAKRMFLIRAKPASL